MDPLPAYIEDSIVYELERKAAITEDPGLLLGWSNVNTDVNTNANTNAN